MRTEKQSMKKYNKRDSEQHHVFTVKNLKHSMNMGEGLFVLGDGLSTAKAGSQFITNKFIIIPFLL